MVTIFNILFDLSILHIQTLYFPESSDFKLSDGIISGKKHSIKKVTGGKM